MVLKTGGESRTVWLSANTVCIFGYSRLRNIQADPDLSVGEKIKSQRQNSYSKGHNRVVISNDSYNSEDQNGPRHQTLNNILHEFNIMQSTNGVQAQSINPQMNVSASSLQKEQVHSSSKYFMGYSTRYFLITFSVYLLS
jgi:hypothetical protein